jgi:hypothetical protein
VEHTRKEKIMKHQWNKTLCLGLGALAVAMLTWAGPAAAKEDGQGLIYGKVVTESGREYTGFLRWGDQEASWSDLFHSAKKNRPFLDDLDKDTRRKLRRRHEISFFKKWVIEVDDDGEFSRMFIARFGDIARIEPHGSGEATVFMKNGSEYEVEGAADDVTSKIHVTDASMGKIELHWDRIDEIQFMPAPRDADPGVWRLYGTVETENGDFEGFIQWDKQECLNIDKLDGDTRDGDVSIEMGRIATIEKKGRRSSLVTLKDGREFDLHGSNDVNHENRGIMVEDERFGRVTIDWDPFERITFTDPPGSGPGYDDFKSRGVLKGTVTDEDGDTYTGRIVIDLDESEGWEMLNGETDDMHYDIPLFRVATIEPGRRECRVVIRGGYEINLEDGTDVTDDNAGILIFTGSDKPVYIEWDDLARIVFE